MQTPAPPDTLDCLVIGGGAAGLTAAIYLARFRRRLRVVDAGASRMLAIPASHNYPGFAGGIRGSEIVRRLREQAEHYGAAILPGAVTQLEQDEHGFVATLDDRHWRARTVIVATGVLDVEPALPEVKDAVQHGCVRYCPICDGFESIGKKVAVVGRGAGGLHEAVFVRHFATEVSLLSLDGPLEPDAQQRAQLEAAGIDGIRAPVERLAFDAAGVMQVHLRDGTRRPFDVVYVALGTLPNSGLAQRLGAACNEDGELLVDKHQQTSIPGLYAAGDVVDGLNQITVAMGHAAIAATAIHNRLRRTAD